VSEVLLPPPGSGPPAGPGGGFGGPFRPGRFIGPGLFTAADSNKDNSLSREEWKATFAKWSSDWDADKDAALNNDELRNGLAAALPRPQLRARHADRRWQGVPERRRPLPRHVVADERRRRRRVPKAAGPAARPGLRAFAEQRRAYLLKQTSGQKKDKQGADEPKRD
jgi:hypothetical protein